MVRHRIFHLILLVNLVLVIGLGFQEDWRHHTIGLACMSFVALNEALRADKVWPY